MCLLVLLLLWPYWSLLGLLLLEVLFFIVQEYRAPKYINQSAIKSRQQWLYNEEIIMHSLNLCIYMIMLLTCAAVDEDRIMSSFTDIKDDFLSRPFNQEVCEVNVMDARSPNYNFVLLQHSKSNA